jgi:hypothetical protein
MSVSGGRRGALDGCTVRAADTGRTVRVTLSRDEQRVLDQIETGLRAADPAFAVKLTVEAAVSDRRRRLGLAHGCLWLGMFMALAGFALVHQVLAAGVLFILYGTASLISALLAMCQLRPVNGVQQRVWRSEHPGQDNSE